MFAVRRNRKAQGRTVDMKKIQETKKLRTLNAQLNLDCRSKVVMSGFTQVKMSAFNFRKEDIIDQKDIRNESSRNRQNRHSRISRIQKT